MSKKNENPERKYTQKNRTSVRMKIGTGVKTQEILHFSYRFNPKWCSILTRPFLTWISQHRNAENCCMQNKAGSIYWRLGFLVIREWQLCGSNYDSFSLFWSTRSEVGLLVLQMQYCMPRWQFLQDDTMTQLLEDGINQNLVTLHRARLKTRCAEGRESYTKPERDTWFLSTNKQKKWIANENPTYSSQKANKLDNWWKSHWLVCSLCVLVCMCSTHF